ncbi:ATP-binding cassette domain-containing protein [Kineococcus sp. GCM10028916]|uniref:ATP-binding cassette domain-containing protein n=1 Tax=Kineococcus sp. GCM10028916 TaxID=3273394 RepID=UPI003641DAEC
MADLTLRGLTVTPAGSRRPVVADVDLDLRHGERVLLVGPSGAGKSTVLRALAGLLEDDVDASGEVLLDGQAPRAGEVGLLVQDPLDAVVAELAGRDTAFGPENAGLDRSLIWQRVARAHAAARYTAGRDREVVTLSGGERQRLALAGTLAADPAVLLLDEPTSMLDAPTARAVRAAVLEAARDRGLVVVDHDLAGWAPHVDRVVVLGRDGRVRADGPPDRVLADPALLADGLWLPGAPAPQPLDLPAGLLRPELHVVGDVLRGNGLGLVRRRRGLRPTPPVAVLHDVDVTLRAGVTTPLTGDSGSGKSSLLAVLGGLERPTGDLVAASGFAPPGRPAPHTWRSRDLAARTGWVPQSPEHSFLATDVRAEVRATPRVLGRDTARADALLDVLGLHDRADVNPFRLSGGEQRRLALAAALAAGPALLLADEPSVGQDRGTWAVVAGLLAGAARDGAAVAVSTHDAGLVHAVAPGAGVHLVAGRSSRGAAAA